MSARLSINVERSPRRLAGFGNQPDPTHRVTVAVAFDLGAGQAALDALDDAVAETKAAIRGAER